MVSWYGSALSGALGGYVGTAAASASSSQWTSSYNSTSAYTSNQGLYGPTSSATSTDWYVNYSTGQHQRMTATQHETAYQQAAGMRKLAEQQSQYYDSNVFGGLYGKQETEKERAMRLFESDLEKAERIEREEAPKIAEEKAMKLLESLIGDEIEVYKKTGRVFVKGRKGAYIVRKDRTVQKIERRKIIDLCVHIESNQQCPSTDHVVALKMLLENDENHILNLANRVGSESRPRELPLAACM